MEKRFQKEALLFLYCLLTAAVMITLCSRSSPLYPFNDWNDTNCFFTVGKAMMNGRVVYRDIYEQKGVLLYFLYGLGWLLSHRSFLGAWVLECLCFAAFLRTAALTAEKRGVLRSFCLVMPALAAILCSSYAFFLGGSAEEIALPFLYPALHVFLTTEDGCLPAPRKIVLLGAMAGCVLWIKFTLLGLYVGYVLFIALLLILRRDFAALGKAAGFFLLGVGLATLPWLLYFGANSALGDWIGVYFLDNMSHYSSDIVQDYGRLYFLRENMSHAILWNGRTSLLIAAGALAVLCGHRKWGFKAGFLLMYLLAVILPFIGGTAFDYYGYAYAPLAVPGALAAARLLESGLARLRLKIGGWARASALLLCLCLVAGAGLFARRHSINSFYADYRREDMWYSRFAEEITAAADQSLLNYGSLDMGLYTLTGYVPQTRFFCHLNLNLPELEEEMDAYVRERQTAFLVMKIEPPEWLLAYYEPVDAAESINQFEGISSRYYLLRRRA